MSEFNDTEPSQRLHRNKLDIPVQGFGEVIAMIQQARQQASRQVNRQLIELYWQIGAYITHKLELAEWGDGVVNQLADYIANTQPGLRGFTGRNLFRMRQFYATYRHEDKVSALLTQLPWTHNLIILSQSKRQEEREFLSSFNQAGTQRDHATAGRGAFMIRLLGRCIRAMDVLTIGRPISTIISNTPAMPLYDAHSGGFFVSGGKA